MRLYVEIIEALPFISFSLNLFSEAYDEYEGDCFVDKFEGVRGDIVEGARGEIVCGA